MVSFSAPRLIRTLAEEFSSIHLLTVSRALESIKAGKRLSESRFPGVNIAPVGVKSVRSMLTK